MMAFLSEAQVETALLEQLAGLGYASDELIGPDGRQPERDAYDEVVLKVRLTAAERLIWARECSGLESFALAGELEPAAVTSRKGAHE
mgnify:CR=1 FL=1|tara:strand:- start:733 stop:996 length:264 start_codon:yes stop_codon:yes gene_type:complete